MQLSLSKRIKRIWPYFVDSRLALGIALIASMFAAATEPALPSLLKPLLDSGFKRSAESFPLWLVPVAIVGLFAIRGLANYISQYAVAHAVNHTVTRLRGHMFERVQKAAPILFTKQTNSSLTNMLVYEVQFGATTVAQLLTTSLRDMLTVVFLLAYLMWTNWQLTLFVFVLAPLVVVVVRALSKRLHRLTLQSQQAVDDLAYSVEENILAWRLVRLHNAGDTQAQRFAARDKTLRGINLKLVAASALSSPITQVMASFAVSAVVVIALWQSNEKGHTVGSFVAFVTSMLLLLAPMKRLSDLSGQFTRGMATLERAVNLIEDTAQEQGGTHQVPRSRGDLQLQDVTLQYPSAEKPALDGLTLQIAAGQSIALVGPSGAGKSSLINLLPRFLEPGSGRVALDGVPLQDWNIANLRSQFALVSQDVVLFNDSVAVNVSLGASMDEARVQDALAAANLTSFVDGLPQGIHTVIGHNGNQLSGGQRQRMAIARAIYKDAPILILDEATSALDSESERLVQSALERLMQGRTAIVIAHRLSTIERADRIAVMDAGRIVEQGTHAQLLVSGGLYARLHSLQFKS